jgi:hypothetical protein
LIGTHGECEKRAADLNGDEYNREDGCREGKGDTTLLADGRIAASRSNSVMAPTTGDHSTEAIPLLSDARPLRHLAAQPFIKSGFVAVNFRMS